MHLEESMMIYASEPVGQKLNYHKARDSFLVQGFKCPSAGLHDNPSHLTFEPEALKS